MERLPSTKKIDASPRVGYKCFGLLRSALGTSIELLIVGLKLPSFFKALIYLMVFFYFMLFILNS